MVSALYIDRRGPYADLGIDCWDESRDATKYDGTGPVICHPPCGPWSRLAHFCGPELLTQKRLGPIAVAQVRRHRGILEHPSHSGLWAAEGLPFPGADKDSYGGYTVEIEQWIFGHKAIKPTWLYCVGIRLPQMPEYNVNDRPAGGRARFNGDPNRSMLERMPATKRHLTPRPFAAWLIRACLNVHNVHVRR